MIDLDALAKLPALSVLEIELIRELGEEREKVAMLREELRKLADTVWASPPAAVV